jgi:hypothetical protein
MENFKKEYQSIKGRTDKATARKWIKELCGWGSDDLFYHKAHGRRKIRVPEVAHIIYVLRKFNV